MSLSCAAKLAKGYSKNKRFDSDLYRHGVAKTARTGQTKVQFNSSLTGGSVESFPNAEDQAETAKSQEAPRGASQASEEAEETKGEDGQCERSEKRIALADFQRDSRTLARLARLFN